MNINLTEYLGVEETNLLTSMVNFRQEFDLFSEVDRIYKEPISRLRISADDDPGLLIGQLYLFVHFHLYFSVSCILRSHLSESFSSCRKAIDAALSAYQIILEPGTVDKYLNRDRQFLFIKSNMQKEIEKDRSKYPLAHRLVQVHDSCSEYGSHADISSFIHRLNVKEIPGQNADLLQFHYFQFPKPKEEYQFYFVLILQIFMLILQIFKLFLNQKLTVVDPEWERAIAKVDQHLDRLRVKYYAFVEKS